MIAVQGLRVLVAEDNSVNQAVVTQILRKRGHSVTMVDNGRDAVAAVRIVRSTSC